MAVMDREGAGRRRLLVALYLTGAAFWFVPTLWLLQGYALAVVAVTAWGAVAAVAVYRSRKRAALALSLGLVGAVNLWLLVAASAWVPFGMVP